MNIPHCIPWKPKKFPSSLPVPRSAPYGVACTMSSVHCELQVNIHMKYTTFANEMILITISYVTFNKYARHFKSHNEMKNRVTLSYTHATLCYTPGMHIYKMKSVTRIRCKLRYTYITHCDSTTETKLTPHNYRNVPR
jgi:hypothetical protein